MKPLAVTCDHSRSRNGTCEDCGKRLGRARSQAKPKHYTGTAGGYSNDPSAMREIRKVVMHDNLTRDYRPDRNPDNAPPARSAAISDAYRDGWERTFGRREIPQDETS